MTTSTQSSKLKLPVLPLGFRVKLALAIITTTVITAVIIGYLSLIRGLQIQTFLGEQLQISVQQEAENQLTSQVQLEQVVAEQFLVNVSAILDTANEYATGLLNEPQLFAAGAYGDARQDLVQLPEGQWDNDDAAAAALFIPAGVTVDEQLFTLLNNMSYLDFLLPEILATYPSIGGIYFIATDGSTVYYPNIDLANQVPPDFDVTNQIFFTVGLPENNPEREGVWTPPYQDPAGTGLIVTYVTPLYDRTGQFRGILGADVQLASIEEQVNNLQVGASGYAILTDATGRILAMPDSGYADLGFTREAVPMGETPQQTVFDQGPGELQPLFQAISRGEQGFSVVSFNNVDHYVAYWPISNIGYSLSLIVPVAELNESVILANEQVEHELQTTLKYVGAVSAAMFVITLFLSLSLSGLLAAPLLTLTRAAQQMATGNLDIESGRHSTDEIGTLAKAFEQMAAQLKGTLHDLESRVAERTNALALTSQVSRRLSTILDLDQLVLTVVEQVKTAFNYYHVHIYFLDEEGQNLKMVGGTGEAGRMLLANEHQMRVGRGLVGHAAATGQIVLVPDTVNDPNWLPNQLLPDTKAEIAVPIVLGGRVLGVLDVQHDITGGLKQEDADLLQSIANQIAIAIQNARQYAQAQESEGQLRAMIDAIPTGVLITRIKDGLVQYANDNAAALFDYPVDSLIGNVTPNLYYNLSDREIVLNILRQEGSLSNYEVLGRRQDGSPIWVTLSVQTMIYAGEPAFYINATDVTERKQSAEALMKRAEHDRVLNRISTKIRSAISVEQILQIATQELRQATGASRSVVEIVPIEQKTVEFSRD